MEDIRESYSFAWVKTVCDEAAAPALPPCGDEPCCDDDPSIKSGDRPPFAAAAASEPVQGGAGGLKTCCDAHHLRLLAPTEVHGEWRVDPIHNGQKGVSFEAIQFIGSRDEAIKWLQEPAGVAWRGNALHVALIRYTKPGKVARETGVPSEPGTASLPEGMTRFPLASWRSDYLSLARHGSGDQDLWLAAAEVDSLTHGLLQTLQDQLKTVGDERGAFPEGGLSEADVRRIRAESSDIAAMKTVAAGSAAADLLDKPATMELLDRVRRETRSATFALKYALNTGRPWDLKSNPPALAIQSGEPLFPAHAALPAGHAVLAYTVAGLMEMALPGLAGEFARRAAEVGANRVRGGFHWPHDVLGGKLVAMAFVLALGSKPRMKDLLVRVTNEWA